MNKFPDDIIDMCRSDLEDEVMELRAKLQVAGNETHVQRTLAQKYRAETIDLKESVEHLAVRLQVHETALIMYAQVTSEQLAAIQGLRDTAHAAEMDRDFWKEEAGMWKKRTDQLALDKVFGEKPL